MRLLVAQCNGSSPPSRPELEEALDEGLGRLIVLEARLRESRLDRSREVRRGSSGVEHDDLLTRVAMLRSAVEELRASLIPSGSPLAYGFVSARPA